MGSQNYHIPVLLRESIAGLAIDPNGVYLDLTYGGGGHSGEILRQLKKGKLIAFDQDRDVLNHLPTDHRLFFVNHNYRFMGRFLDYLGIRQVDGILADLGVSSHHLDAPERGFSFRYHAPLDMRMNTQATKTAAEVLNQSSQEELTRMLREYGELDRPGAWAAKIVQARASQPLSTTTDLVDCLQPLLKKGKEHKDLAKVFQAVRIAVNEELAGLEAMLEQSVKYLRPGGRLVVISYHSLEDRLVKNYMRAGNAAGRVAQDLYGKVLTPFKVLSKKVVVPETEELERNPRSRSAKMRIAERIA